jgi:hypothetical protein
MTEFQVEKGVPAPEERGRNATLYPWREMEVGDSFFAAGKTSQKLQSAAWHWRHNGWKFVARKETKDGVKGARIWRVE